MFQTNVVQKIKTHILGSETLFLEKGAVYGKMWKNFLERSRPQMTTCLMRFACWIPNTTDTHSEYVIFIAFPLHQWLQERASILRYTFIDCIVTNFNP